MRCFQCFLRKFRSIIASKAPITVSSVLAAKMVEALRSGQWSDCMRIARENEKYTGRSQVYERVNNVCWPSREGCAEAYRDAVLLEIRYL